MNFQCHASIFLFNFETIVFVSVVSKNNFFKNFVRIVLFFVKMYFLCISDFLSKQNESKRVTMKISNP